MATLRKTRTEFAEDQRIIQKKLFDVHECITGPPLRPFPGKSIDQNSGAK